MSESQFHQSGYSKNLTFRNLKRKYIISVDIPCIRFFAFKAAFMTQYCIWYSFVICWIHIEKMHIQRALILKNTIPVLKNTVFELSPYKMAMYYIFISYVVQNKQKLDIHFKRIEFASLPYPTKKPEKMSRIFYFMHMHLWYGSHGLALVGSDPHEL